jgi:hypothetical protein
MTEVKKVPGINESMLRLSFLEQAAGLIHQSSSSPSDSYNKISKCLVKQIKEVCLISWL